MRKLFALILILGVLACALGFYAADTFETSDYYRVLNPVFRTAVGHDIDPDTVKDVMAIHVDGNLPGVGEFNFSLNALIDGGVDLPGLGHVSLSDLLGKELNFGQRLQAKAVIAGYGWSHELKLYCGRRDGVPADWNAPPEAQKVIRLYMKTPYRVRKCPVWVFNCHDIILASPQILPATAHQSSGTCTSDAQHRGTPGHCPAAADPASSGRARSTSACAD